MTPLRWLYAVLSAITLAVFGLYACRGWLGEWSADWMPNVGTSALTILATVAVVDRLIRKHEEERLRPRIEAAQDNVSEAFHHLVTAIAGDYIETHVRNYEELPNEVGEVLDFWIARHEEEDTPRAGPGPPQITRAAYLVSEMLERAWRDDREVLDPALLVAARDLAMRLRQAPRFYALRGALNHPSDRAERAHVVAPMVVEAAKNFLQVYRLQPDAILTLTEFDLSALKGARIMVKSAATRLARGGEAEADEAN